MINGEVDSLALGRKIRIRNIKRKRYVDLLWLWLDCMVLGSGRLKDGAWYGR